VDICGGKKKWWGELGETLVNYLLWLLLWGSLLLLCFTATFACSVNLGDLPKPEVESKRNLHLQVVDKQKEGVKRVKKFISPHNKSA
jgi:hypothetical protein